MTTLCRFRVLSIVSGSGYVAYGEHQSTSKPILQRAAAARRLTSPTSVISFAEKPAACAACSSADFSSGAKPIANWSRIASLPKLEEFLDDAASEIVTQMIQEQRWRKA